jgi:hypothetical protein
VISETIDGEVVIINLGTGNYYSLQDSGAIVWRGLEQGATLDELEQHFVTAFADAGAVRDLLDAFVEQLLFDGLLVVADGAPPAIPSLDAPTADAFEAPRLERFTDMQDLILLDPVHDVDAEAGWPSAKRPAQEAAGDVT